jgi:hypothetical protein
MLHKWRYCGNVSAMMSGFSNVYSVKDSVRMVLNMYPFEEIGIEELPDFVYAWRYSARSFLDYVTEKNSSSEEAVPVSNEMEYFITIGATYSLLKHFCMIGAHCYLSRLSLGTKPCETCATRPMMSPRLDICLSCHLKNDEKVNVTKDEDMNWTPYSLRILNICWIEKGSLETECKTITHFAPGLCRFCDSKLEAYEKIICSGCVSGKCGPVGCSRVTAIMLDSAYKCLRENHSKKMKQ